MNNTTDCPYCGSDNAYCDGVEYALTAEQHGIATRFPTMTIGRMTIGRMTTSIMK